VPLICLTLTARTLDEDIALARKYAPLVDLVELRADCLAPSETAAIGAFPASVPEPALLTARRKAAGGAFEGSEAARESLFAAVGAFAYVDFESDFNPAAAMRAAQAAGVRVIRSLHLFDPCSGDIAARADSLCRAEGEIPKIAFLPRTLADVAALFRTTATLPPRDRVFCAMGPLGTVSRVLAGRARSFLTYVSPKELLANTAGIGHLDPERLNEVYSFRSITDKTLLCGVTGWPLAVTSSPEVHRAFYVRDNLDAVLVPLPAEDIGDAIGIAETLGLKGLAVTIPHKESLLRFLDEKDEAVDAIGAANTVVWRNGRRHGYNTDAAGFTKALTNFLGRNDLNGQKVAILGAGGAARAIAYAIWKLGGNATVYARDISRASTVATPYGFASATLADLGDGRHPDLIVQCTSVGHGATDPSADPIPHYAFDGHEALYDLVYKPAVTPVMARARAAGCRVESGMSMLRAQAELQHRLWFPNR
jgi:3-dehydroquinate dehydratase/shikimate dehydrogenase